MIFSRRNPDNKKLLGVRFHSETCKALLDLCKFYQLPKDDVLTALVMQDWETVWEKKGVEKPNPFVITPRELDWG